MSSSILHVITTLQTGGAERMLTRVIQETRMQAQHAVIALAPGGQFYDELKAAGIPIFIFPITNPVQALLKLFGLANFVTRQKADTICGWMTHGNAIAALIKLYSFSRAKLVWHIRMTLYDFPNETFGQKIGLWFCKLLSWAPDVILYNSAEGRRQHEAFGFRAQRGALIDNGFDLDVLKPDEDLRRQTRQQLGVRDQEILIGLVARYHPMKNHKLFLEAAAQIHQQFSNSKFLFAGLDCDANNQELAALLERYGLRNAAILLGPRTDISAINNALDIAVNTSSWGEAFSNTLAEAMACGTPCVATDIGGAAHIIADTGIIVPPNDPAALTAAIAGMIGKCANLRAAARERIARHFDIIHIAQKYLAYYRRG